jgi:N-methylhydantoinase A/oxoprolinase/acetone carboxylase beta subunit
LGVYDKNYSLRDLQGETINSAPARGVEAGVELVGRARLELVVFDMAGTTVDDVIDGVPLVLRSYDDAFRRYGVEVPM